ncbi:unnamed protein product [Miscanthus lutarioriparius]|uniref:Uncharacterized protein n=1 Tax=Miscanthus lutarioriparius TaxID=422564 RepID=A0A811PZF1_9POAL|nr:unnamed protein product [Miscanthus lutarioriparius]
MAMAGRGLLALFFSAAVVAGLTSAANGPFLSDSVFQLSAGSTGRSLLQAKNVVPHSIPCSSGNSFVVH